MRPTPPGLCPNSVVVVGRMCSRIPCLVAASCEASLCTRVSRALPGVAGCGEGCWQRAPAGKDFTGEKMDIPCPCPSPMPQAPHWHPGGAKAAAHGGHGSGDAGLRRGGSASSCPSAGGLAGGGGIPRGQGLLEKEAWVGLVVGSMHSQALCLVGGHLDD